MTPFSGNFIEGLIDSVDRVLMPYRECDGHNFDHGIPVECPMEPVCNINGQDFCVKHMSQAWEPEDDIQPTDFLRDEGLPNRQQRVDAVMQLIDAEPEDEQARRQR